MIRLDGQKERASDFEGLQYDGRKCAYRFLILVAAPNTRVKMTSLIGKPMTKMRAKAPVRDQVGGV